jgi:protein-disulfide isomerase
LNRIFITIFLILIITTSFIYYRKSLTSKISNTNTDFSLGPISFHTKALESTDLAATFLNMKYSHIQLMERSPILKELAIQELNLLIQAASKVISSMSDTRKKPLVIIMTPKPFKDYVFDKSKFGFNLKFSIERPFGNIIQINKKKYFRKDLDMNQIRYSEIKTQQFNERLRVVKNLYVRQLLLKLAKQKKMNIEELIQSESPNFRVGKLKIIDKIIEAKFPDETADIFFYPPSYIFSAANNKVIMLPDQSTEKKLTLMVFGGINCSNCNDLLDSLNNIQNKYSNKIRIGFVQFFQNTDWKKILVAEASMCLNSQSYKAFLKFNNKLIQNQNITLSESFVMSMASGTDVDFNKFKNCMLSQTFKEEVEKQIEYSYKIGITKAPTIIIGGAVLTNNILDEQLNNAIKSIL